MKGDSGDLEKKNKKMNDLCKKKRNEMINKIIREEKKNGNIDVKESCFDAELIDISGINFG